MRYMYSSKSTIVLTLIFIISLLSVMINVAAGESVIIVLNYIPINLSNCFTVLDKVLKKEDIEKIRNISEGDMALYHRGLEATGFVE